MPTAIAEKPICDFCSGQPVTHLLPARDFILDQAGSTGDWAACAICAMFIMQNDWKGITTRAVNRFRTRYDREPTRDEVDAILLVHSNVRRNIIGPIRHV